MTSKSEAAEQWQETYAGAAEKWAPKAPGDQLIGKYVGFTTIVLDDGSEVRYYDIRDDGGDLWSVPNSVQIVKCFEGVEPGARVRLTFKGTLDLGKPGQSPMKNYSLEVAR